MKKIYVFSSLYVLAYFLMLTMSFALASCDNGTTNGSSNGNDSGRATLSLSGQIRRPLSMKRQDRVSDAYQNYNPGRSLTINSNLGVNGTISATGQISFTIGTPNIQYLATHTELVQFMAYTFPVYRNITFTPADTLITFLELSFDGPDPESGNETIFSLYRERNTGTVNNRNGSGVDEGVFYIYVNKDVTVTMQGGSLYGSIYNNANLNLRHGWNTVRSTEMWNITNRNETSVFNLSVADPVNFVWVASD